MLFLCSIPVVKGPFDPAAMKVKGAQNFVQTVADITRVFVSGCDGILSNDTLMAQLKVKDACSSVSSLWALIPMHRMQKGPSKIFAALHNTLDWVHSSAGFKVQTLTKELVGIVSVVPSRTTTLSCCWQRLSAPAHR